MDPMQKRPAYIYAKDFKLNKVLGNLQAYKLATGDVDSKEIDSVTKKYGGDEGAIFGSLITNAAGETKRKAEEERTHTLKRKRRKKQKKRRGAERDETQENSSSTFLQTVELDEPLAIPQALLAYDSSESEDTVDHSESHCTEDGMDTSSTSESDEMHDGKDQNKQPPLADFFGLTNSQFSSDSDDSSSVNRSTKEKLATSGATSRIQPDLTSKRLHPVSTALPSEGLNNLSTYKCWKCKRRGHLAEDCTAFLNSTQGTICYGRGLPASGPTLYQGKRGKTIYSPLLREYYQKCKKLQSSHNAQCTECGRKSNLGSCLECGLVLCDGRGHLTAHILDYPTHTKWYSYKLQRQIKCCKSTCEVMDIDKLLMCSSCLDKFFNVHYSMVNATWSGKGLKAIPNTLACDEHFHWHRMNCLNIDGEKLATREKLESTNRAGDGFLSEFYF